MVTLSTHSWNFGDTVAGISCLIQSRIVTPFAPSTVESPMSARATAHRRAPVTPAFLLDRIPWALSISAARPLLSKTKPGTPAPRRLVEPFVSAGGRSCARPANNFSVEHYNRCRCFQPQGELTSFYASCKAQVLQFAEVEPTNPHFLSRIQSEPRVSRSTESNRVFSLPLFKKRYQNVCVF